jgi:hypothetical protein
MLIFNLTIHNLWGRVLTNYPQVRSLAYVDDGYIKTRMSVTLQVLVELKHVLKEDTVLDLNISKTSVLPKGVTQQVVFDVAHNIINNNPVLTPLNVDVSLTSFYPEGFIGSAYWYRHSSRLAFVRDFLNVFLDIQTFASVSMLHVTHATLNVLLQFFRTR